MLNRREIKKRINTIADVTLIISVIVFAIALPIASIIAFPPALGIINIMTPILIGAGIVLSVIAREIAREIADRHYFG